jgi:crotonobetainyl-CoA:carnitine CoA-transferase CaiB-like acyl-CoA transferase
MLIYLINIDDYALRLNVTVKAAVVRLPGEVTMSELSASLSVDSVPGRSDTGMRHFLELIWQALGGRPALLENVAQHGHGGLPSVFAVTDLATASIAAAGLALAELIGMEAGTPLPRVGVDRRLASFWFGFALRPQGWELPPVWDPIAGDYQSADGWIRLHTNAPHHCAAALSVLGVPADKAAVAAAVSRWSADELEAAVVAAKGCAATMRSQADWLRHPQGRAVGEEPLLHWATFPADGRSGWALRRDRPLAGIRVLDLTRVLAGPTATRFLAGYGASVLRIDPPFWDEPALEPELTVGKQCAGLDLRRPGDVQRLEALIAEADIMVHGYRADALAGLGLDAACRRRLNPALIDVSLDAYGWTGPWRDRRGFDSLVQMSCGIAEAGMRLLGRDRPTPLPVQALDCATGYVMAAAAIRALAQRRQSGAGAEIRLSLARVARLLMSLPPAADMSATLQAESAADLAPALEATAWGPARRLAPPLTVDAADMRWDRPAGRLRVAAAAW